MSAPSVTQDWTQFDPAAYLDEYYGDIGSENLELLRFLAETYRMLPRAECCSISAGDLRSTR